MKKPRSTKKPYTVTLDKVLVDRLKKRLKTVKNPLSTYLNEMLKMNDELMEDMPDDLEKITLAEFLTWVDKMNKGLRMKHESAK